MTNNSKKKESGWDWFRTYYNNYGYEILAILSVIVILLAALFKVGKRGTASSWNSVMHTLSMRSKNKNFVYHTIPNHASETHGSSILERKTRIILERIFNKPFVKIRPDFLVNELTGKNMEIDLYNDELGLAVEVQGKQHYKYTPYFHRSEEVFQNQQARDQLKKEKILAAGLIFIEVPYTVGTSDNRIYQFLVSELNSKLN
jgi:hypothetical protein